MFSKKLKQSLFVALGLSALMFSNTAIAANNNLILTSYATELNSNNGPVAEPNNGENLNCASWHMYDQEKAAILIGVDRSLMASYYIDPVDEVSKYFYAVDGSLLSNKWLPHPDNDGSFCFINSYGQMTVLSWVDSQVNKDKKYFLGEDGKAIATFNSNSSINFSWFGNKQFKNYWIPNPYNPKYYQFIGPDGNFTAISFEKIYYNGENKYLFRINDSIIINKLIAHPDNDGSICYVDLSGQMLTNKTWINSPYGNDSKYLIASDGKVIAKCITDPLTMGNWTYYWPDNTIITNYWLPHPIYDRHLCLVGPTGKFIARYTESKFDGSKYFYGLNGKIIKNQTIQHPDNDGSLCLVNKDGKMVTNCSINHIFNGKGQTIGADGKIH